MNMSGRSLANSGFGRGGIGGAGASGFGRGGIGGAGGANGFGRGGLNGSALGASRGNFGYGARAPISSAARLGGANAFGRGGMNNRAGAGLTSTAFNRGGFSNNSFNNNSFNLNRASFTNNVNVNSNRFGGGGFGRSGYYGGWGYGRNGYGGWGNGGWGNGGWGNGGWGWGNRGWGWGGNGWGGGWGWGGGGWGGGWGYGGLGLGWGGLGWGWGGLGWGWGGLGGWGWGNGYGWGGYGMGLWPWLYGSSLYNWGYLNYYNPYYYGGYGLAGFGYPVSTTVVVQPTVYDYSQPINTQATPPAPSVADQVGNGFDAARDAFKAGDYTRALELADQAIKQMPNDAALHEFRGVVLFALHRYEDAAAPLYAVLSVGPGWDWGTFVGLYPDVGVYTEQLRALENYCNANPNSAAPRFVLAYLYLTQGHSDQALAQLKRVVALQPKDMISARLIQRLETTSTPNAGAPNPLPAAAPAAPATNLNPTSLKEGRLEGAWTAQPDPETTITLTFLDQGRFVWKVTHKGQDRLIQGKLTTGNGLLTLAQDMGSPMVGNLMWLDESHFTFKVPGSGADDAGLSFSKAP
jgi:tetratricopeptide (TPR) repeat protein